MPLTDLLTLPPGVTEAAETLARLDRCFLAGFSRLGADQLAELQNLASLCAGTPLEAPITEAVAALGRNEFLERHFVALAAARAAIQASIHDALRSQALAALGRTEDRAPLEISPATPTPAALETWQESTRHWLMELALAGFKQLEQATLAPFAATLEQMQAEPALTRLAALLTGFQQELLDAMPVATRESVPVYRWVDLWCRAMLLAAQQPRQREGMKVGGTLSILGVELRRHGFFASALVYGLLAEKTGPARFVRVTLSSYKVDVVVGGEVWQCLAEQAEHLLAGISDHRTLGFDGATLLPTGDLLWRGKAKAGAKYSAIELAEKWFTPGANPAPLLPRLEPLDRHPVHLAEPVYLEGYQAGDNGRSLDCGDGLVLPMTGIRDGLASELRIEDLEGSKGLFGLLRFDGGGWQLQPLAVRKAKGSEVFTGVSAAAWSVKKKDQTLAILQERAGKLLRKKA
jgi:hypothetical protein